MLMLKRVRAKLLKHVLSNTDKTINANRWASVVRMPSSNMFNTRLSKRTKHRPSNTQTREMFKVLRFYQTRSNSTKQGVQTVKCLVTKQCLMVFGRQTFPVW